ncbi:MaoC/PaaZ C-terminal domain-containing protein [Jiangella asiatica]|uniref:Dehydratase n=1 Tax=Jiangella asiatica TaxID=2530372 RepID=A0A4R5DXC4_9ACTN|nr:MaoC/PaaZ C-terminal domain-containing protein [Jiangella asiatica]TDE15975.1 dehydratase [Jiangella asiatica]
MISAIRAPAVVAGEVVAREDYRLTRLDLLRYAGASGDFNPIHWSQRVARSAGLPDVIAHGTLTLGLVARSLTGWLGDPARLADLTFRFARPVPVPDDGDGATVRVVATIAELRADGCAVVTVEVTAGGSDAGTVGRGRAVVRL